MTDYKYIYDMENAVDNAFNDFKYINEICQIDYLKETKPKVRSTEFWNYVQKLDKEALGFRDAIEKALNS